MHAIELFAGAGGLGVGLREAGFHHKLVVDSDRHCCRTLCANSRRRIRSGREHIVEADVRTINFREFEGKIDLLSGGPPCQPFSLGGKHRAYLDSRDMFPEAIRAVREIKPRAFLFENVKGLTRPAFRNYFDYIKLHLSFPEVIRRTSENWDEHLNRLREKSARGQASGLHYRVAARILNAADFGVPQCRRRVFIVGFRGDLGLDCVFPVETHSHEALTMDQQSGGYWERHRISRRARTIRPLPRPSTTVFPFLIVKRPWLTVRDAICDLPDPERHPKEASLYLNHVAQPGARAYSGHDGSPLDEPAKTIKAGVHGVPGGENMLRREDGSVRYFTVRECARLQTFPDDYHFVGSWTECMRQLGNAVPVRLAAAVGDSVFRSLAALRRAPVGD